MTEQTESEKRAAENQAKLVIAGGDIAPDELLSLIGKLRKHRGFGLARRALEKRLPKIVGDDQSAKGKAKIRKLTQQLSLCTYKDPDLNPLERLDRALQVLAGLDDLELSSAGCTKDQESLGQAGAIFKRKWELTNQAGHLETSLAYYSRGYDQGVAKDFGYTGINAAFVLDLLASLEVSKA
ncbi:MAG: hypothetical protein FIA97_05045, partial [Methylococcaceae bacterium]|nr:hypothetical protein [Methylococcaceae bacterium]